MARERDIGARLEHPDIARLYDAGVDSAGRPYLAFEYIDGQPMDRWCAARGLAVAERLRLFLQVLRAVAYAHAHLVVHRDIKPSNVLVDAQGRAHLLDFGIAKLLESTTPGATWLTQQGSGALTPQYASPEQILGEPVTAVSDVYSLGVVLYELLTSQLPHSPRRKSFGAMEEAILSGDPPLASSRVRDRALARALRGDLDSILAKALQRDPARRYASADAFADDILRHLEGEVVRAKSDTPWYRVRKAIARHRIAFASTLVLSLSVITATTAFLVQTQRADAAAARTREVAQFVDDVFRVNDAQGPSTGRVGRRPGETLVETSLRLIEARFAAQPALQAELYGVVGGIFSDMGAPRLAADYVDRQLAALESAQAGDEQRARPLLAAAQARFEDQRFADAETHARQAFNLGRRDAVLQQDAMLLLARIYVEQGRNKEARETMQIIALRFPPGERTAMRAWSTALSARLLQFDNRLDQALPLFHQAVQTAIEATGADSRTTIDIRLLPAEQLSQAGFGATAREFALPAVEALRRLGGAHAIRAEWVEAMHPELFAGNAEGRPETPDLIRVIEASRERLRRQAMSVPERMLAQIDMNLAMNKSSYGEIEGARLLMANADPWLSTIPATPAETFARVSTMGLIAMQSGSHEAAAQWLSQREAARTAMGTAEHPYAKYDYILRARNLSMAGRHDEADVLLIQAAPHLDRVKGPRNLEMSKQLILEERARIALNRGDPNRAIALLEDDPDEARHDGVEPSNPQVMRGEALCATGDPDTGLQLLQRQDVRYAHTQHPASPALAYVRSQAGLCALKSGDKRLATSLARKARDAFVAQAGVSPYYKAPLKRLEQLLGLHLAPV